MVVRISFGSKRHSTGGVAGWRRVGTDIRCKRETTASVDVHVWDEAAVHQTVFPSYHVSVIGVTNAFCVWTIYERMRLQVRGAYDERMRDSAVHSQMQALAAKELDEKSLFRHSD